MASSSSRGASSSGTRPRTSRSCRLDGRGHRTLNSATRVRIPSGTPRHAREPARAVTRSVGATALRLTRLEKGARSREIDCIHMDVRRRDPLLRLPALPTPAQVVRAGRPRDRPGRRGRAGSRLPPTRRRFASLAQGSVQSFAPPLNDRGEPDAVREAPHGYLSSRERHEVHRPHITSPSRPRQRGTSLVPRRRRVRSPRTARSVCEHGAKRSKVERRTLDRGVGSREEHEGANLEIRVRFPDAAPRARRPRKLARAPGPRDCGVEQEQLAWLITKRTRVQITPPQPRRAAPDRASRSRCAPRRTARLISAAAAV